MVRAFGTGSHVLLARQNRWRGPRNEDGACRSSRQPEELCGWVGEATRGEAGYKSVGSNLPLKLTGVARSLRFGNVVRGINFSNQFANPLKYCGEGFLF